ARRCHFRTGPVPRRCVDRYRLAGHHGGRGSQRRCCGRGAPDPARTTGRGVMTVTVSVLDRNRSTLVRELQAAVARLDPGSRLPASYHFGWCDPEGNPTPSGNGGKAMRSAFALLSAEAVGATTETGLPGAVAVELVHNFSLIHDDLLDGDVE